MDKQALRQHLKEQRLALSPAAKRQYDHDICEQLKVIAYNIAVHAVHVYLPMPGEIDVRPFIQTQLERDATVVCPKTLPKGQLENRMLTSLDAVEEGIYGTTHPTGPKYEGGYDLIIVPGLAYDDTGYRLGYGGGYYDRFLSEHPLALVVGVFYDFQRVERVPREEHDIALHKVVVNLGIS